MKEEKEEVMEDFDLEKEAEPRDAEAVEEFFQRVISRNIRELERYMAYK